MASIVPTLTPELYDALRQRVEHTLLHLINKNRPTRYVRESPVFSDFRTALDARGDANDESLLESFRTIPLTAYDSYEPFINKLVIQHSNESDVKDMFSPGLPYFIAGSSATSGKKPKLFAKYRHVARSSLQDVDEHANPISAQGGKNCIVYSLTYREVIEVIGDDKTTVGRFPITSMSSGVIRMQHGIDVDRDPFFITLTGTSHPPYHTPVSDPFTLAPRATSPVAVSFIVNYRSFLLMHILFALADSQLETVNTLFGYVFVDMIRHMEEEWDALIHAIETGVLPDWEGTSHVRQYLEVTLTSFTLSRIYLVVYQPKFTARPERAAHLRAVGKATDQPGWLKKLWPGLNVVIGIASGVFSIIIPKVRGFAAPSVRHSTPRRCSITSAPTSACGVWDSPQAKLTSAPRSVPPISVSSKRLAMISSSSLTCRVRKPHPTWSLPYAYFLLDTCHCTHPCVQHQVKLGHRYEVVVTTRDGLWRYRLGDVIEIAGFDSTDGSPILRYIERRGYVFSSQRHHGCQLRRRISTSVRVQGVLVGEEELTGALFSSQDVLGSVTEMTVIVDDRKVPSSLAYLVEIDGDLGEAVSFFPN